MCSFGKPLTGAGGTKFYTGNKDDTPWNRDLLWKVFVDTEAEVQKRPLDKREGCIGIRRTHMGVTGTLIPESMYAVLLQRQKEETLRQRREGSATGRSRQSTARSTGRRSATARSAAGSAAGSARSARTSKTVRDLKTTLVGEVRRRQEAENQIEKMRQEMEAMRAEIDGIKQSDSKQSRKK